MRTANNKIVVDLKKVQWAKYFYINQWHNTRDKEPKEPTAHGTSVPINSLAPEHKHYPGETMVDRSIRLGIKDTWEPRLILQLTANHSLVYTGKKATEVWAAWRSKIFGKK